jgi:hypothetical protein
MLEFPSATIHYLDNNWLASIRKFLSFIDGTLHVDKVCAGMPQSARSNDSNMMDCINKLTKITRSNSLSFNHCRLFMGVTHLSEIASASGTKNYTRRMGRHPSLPHNSPMAIPAKARPRQLPHLASLPG